MKSIAIQIVSVVLVFTALFLSIPPIPSVEIGHGYDSFPNPTLFIGLVLIIVAAFLTVKYLNFPKTYWYLSVLFYVLFSLAIHARVWW
ncbi:hypothetical protein [Pseudoalteromonas sp. NJ631]|uniref:hypothetical protein n=1 Tax=Pseudoalteromonas sp. NJ631 TaxID=493915 RepID=UPI0012FB7857|nr:hypothetical protein [Pseudoalteromonas sp. NJ631]